jgi:hypothetical protein
MHELGVKQQQNDYEYLPILCQKLDKRLLCSCFGASLLSISNNSLHFLFSNVDVEKVFLYGADEVYHQFVPVPWRKNLKPERTQSNSYIGE